MSTRLLPSSTASCALSLASLAAALWLASSAPAQPQPEVCIPQANAGVPQVIAPGEHVCGPGGSGLADLSPVGRIDIYTFQYEAGETVWFHGYSAGCLDLQLRVLDPAMGLMVVASTSCSGNGPFGCVACGTSLVLDPSLMLASGGYLMEVSDAGSDETGSYSLSMERITPPIAPLLPNATLVSDTISPVTDVDILGFDAVQGSLVNLFLSTDGCLDLEYRVLDAAGQVVHGPATIVGNGPFGCISNQVSVNPFAVAGNANAPAPATATYWVVLRDSGTNETGTYDAQVQCLFSPTGCPQTGNNFSLEFTQPTGSRSLAIDVTHGEPGAPYITAFSFDPINAGAPHTGWFGGLHIGYPELAFEVSLGFPFSGYLDTNGASSFATLFPAGPFPPIYAVTVELSPNLLHLVRATPVITANLL